MFTGLVAELGLVASINYRADSAVITVSAPKLAPEIKLGDSISVNGVCLSATSVTADSFTADVMVQTLKLTSLKDLAIATPLNLELAARVSDRLGGHIVQGHVDGVAIVQSLVPGEKWAEFKITIPADLKRYVVNQGSITVDGVSLTVGDIDDKSSTVTLWLIPETLERTNLASKRADDLVNIEVDILAKYVERLLEKRNQ